VNALAAGKLDDGGVLVKALEDNGFATDDEGFAGREFGKKTFFDFTETPLIGEDNADGEVVGNGADVEVVLAGDALGGNHEATIADDDFAVEGTLSRVVATEDFAATGEVFNDAVEISAGEVEIGTGAADELEGFVEFPFTFDSHAEERLGEDIQGGNGWAEMVEAPLGGSVAKSDALKQVGEREGDKDAAGTAIDPVPAATKTLDGTGDAAGGADEEHLIDGGEVDAEFEGGGTDDGFPAPFAQAGFNAEAGVAINGGMMNLDEFVPLGEDDFEGESEALGGGAGSGKDEGTASLFEMIGDGEGNFVGGKAGGGQDDVVVEG
jgi:hypothetical protein